MKTEQASPLVLILAVTICSSLLFLESGMSQAFRSRSREVALSGPSDSITIAVEGETPEDWVQRIREVPGVVDVARAVWPPAISTQSTTYLSSTKTKSCPAFGVMAIDPTYFRIRHLIPRSGRLLRPDDLGKRVAVVGAGVAEKMGWTIGSRAGAVSGEFAETYEVVGVLQPCEESDGGVFGNGSPVDFSVCVPLDRPATPEHSLFVSGFWARQTNYLYWIGVEDGRMEQTTADIRSLFASLTADEVTFHSSAISTVRRIASSQYERSFLLVMIVVYVACMVAFAALFLARLVGRSREIGILRTLGMSGRRVVLSQIGGAAALGLIGTLLGLALFLLCRTYVGLPVDWMYLRSRAFWGALTLSLAIGPFGVADAAFTASRITPMSSIRDELRWGDRRRLLDLRQMLVLLALVLAVSASNLSANLRVATISRVNGYLAAAGSNDIEVKPDPYATVYTLLDPSEFPRIREAVGTDVPQAYISYVTGATCSSDGAKWQEAALLGFLGSPTAATGWEVEGCDVATLAGDEIVVGEKIARALSPTGDPIGMSAYIGSAGRAYRVAGVIKARPQGIFDRDCDRNQTIIMNYDTFAVAADAFAAESKVAIRCVSQEQASTVLAVLTERFPSLKATRPLGEITAMRQLEDRFSIWVLFGAIGVALVVAMAVAAIMWIRVWEGRRHIAIQMAVGASSQQVAWLATRDATTLIIIAAILGVIGGNIVYAVIAVAAGLPVVTGFLGTAAGLALGLVIAAYCGLSTYLRVRNRPIAFFLRAQG